MFRATKIGTLLGSDLRLHWSWPVVPVAMGGYGLFVYSWIDTVFFLALLAAVYLAVLIHEAAQLIAARRFGLRTRDVTLYPFWGLARYARLSDRPWQENYVAAVGPIVLALFATAIGGGLALLGRGIAFDGEIGPPYLESYLVYAFWATVLLTAFQCLPLLPLDGGRVLRASLAMSTSRLRATEVAAGLSTVGAGLLVVSAVAWFRNPLPGLVGVLLYLSAQDDLGLTRYFAGLRHKRDGKAGSPVMIPMDQIVTADCRPDEVDFTGFTWNDKARLWIEWRDGQPVSANALIGD